MTTTIARDVAKATATEREPAKTDQSRASDPPPVANATPLDVERLVAELEALEKRVRVLEGRDRARDELHAAACVALAAAVQYRTFTAKSAIAHARHADRELLGALRAAGVDTPRTLGRWLRTVQRTPIAGLRVECQGKNGDGALWVFRPARD